MHYYCHCRLQTGYAVGGQIIFTVFAFRVVRGVIRSYTIDSPVQQTLPQCLQMFGGAQGRIDLGVSIVIPDNLIGQNQVVRGHFTGDVDAPGFGFSYQLHGALGGSVTDMHMAASQFS